VDVISPGGTQRVEWHYTDGIWLSGWAELVAEAEWLEPGGN